MREQTRFVITTAILLTAIVSVVLCNAKTTNAQGNMSTASGANMTKGNMTAAGAAKNMTTEGSGYGIDDIGCNAMEQAAFHIHAHLDIFINGVHFIVPSEIGITGACFYWLHTHDESGIIHIEAPMLRDFTLGQFFDIWNKKFSNGQIFRYVANVNNPLEVYVNGTQQSSKINDRDIKLHAHDEIAIVYGTPPSTIPKSYTFAEGL